MGNAREKERARGSLFQSGARIVDFGQRERERASSRDWRGRAVEERLREMLHALEVSKWL